MITETAADKKLNELCINTIRMLAVDAVETANSGHPGTPMGCAALSFVLWTHHLKHNPKNPKWINRDRFVLSAGHASMLLYSLLHLTGYDLGLDELKAFRQWDSKTPGHPEYGCAPGVELTTGPLGQGFAAGVGMAIAERYLANYFNRPGFNVIDYHVYALCSDGDIMEGISGEAASIAGHLGLGKLIYIYDDNRITIDGSTALAMSEDTGKRFEAYGWHVQRVDGNSLEEVDAALSQAKSETAKPSFIIARTHIGYGSPGKVDTSAAHGAPLGKDEVSRTKTNLGWPQEPKFFIPGEVMEYFRRAVEQGGKENQEWQSDLESYTAKYPELASQAQTYFSGILPSGWETTIPEFRTDSGPMATRSASGKVLNAIARSVPMVIGGSADLATSTDALLSGMGDFEAATTGRNLHFGIREHAMGAIMNGMALSGALIPFGATFLIFSDYMRPAIRIAALSGLHTIYVFTHDSIGLGEDGPTHQPIEHLASLRAIPNLIVIRPCDANETVYAWKVAMQHRGGPVALVLTRQKLPVIDRSVCASAAGLMRGAYILADAGLDAKGPEIILIATGSEVPAALLAHQRLCKDNVSSRVVSMPSWELFENQPRSYKDEVLPPTCLLRIAIEAASPFGWERYTSTNGIIIGMRRFGASAPGEVTMEKFGFTSENIVKCAKELLKRHSGVSTVLKTLCLCASVPLCLI